MSRRPAATETKSADLATDFGYAYAVRLFGQEAIDSLPVRTVGKNKGRPKGFVIWKKTTEAGWHPNVSGGVGAGIVVRAWIGAGPFSGESDALEGVWLGRRQNLCGSRCLLGEDNRRAWMAATAGDRNAG